MKKVLSLLSVMVMAILLVPMVPKAATGIVPNCGNKDAQGNVTCTIVYNITSSSGLSNLTVTLTEEGGADITSIVDADDSEWSVGSKTEATAGVWTVNLVSPGVSGEGNLFKFTYKASGSTDCKIRVALNNETATITPNDTPTDNKQTGATLPYIALGAVVILATGAYLATRNKAKMYKI